MGEKSFARDMISYKTWHTQVTINRRRMWILLWANIHQQSHMTTFLSFLLLEKFVLNCHILYTMKQKHNSKDSFLVNLLAE